MANSTTTIDVLVQSQASKEVTVNAYFDAAYPATLYGRRASTSASLVWGYYGGNVTKYDGSLVQIANGTVTLTTSTTNYIVAKKSDGVISTSTATTNWNNTTEYWRIYSVVTGLSTVGSYIDYRELGKMTGGGVPIDNPVINDDTMSRTLSLTDSGSWIRFTSTSAITLNIPLNATVAFSIGKVIEGVQASSGQLTFNPISGVTLNIPMGCNAKTRAQGSSWGIIKVSTDTWDLVGDLEVIT